jgi:predicted MFS family arabinose efflux permease
MLVVPRFPGVSGRKFDLLGFVCIAAGLVALLLAVSEGQIWGWSSYPVLILLAASVNLLLLFVIIEMEVEQPLLDVRVFRYWPFANSLILITILTVDLFAVLYYVPQFLQNGQGITPMNTGLVVLPQALAMIVVIPFSGRLYDRYGARWPAVAGLMLTATGIAMMVQINSDATRPEIVMWTTVLGAGAALCITPILTAGLSSLPNEITNFGSAYTTLFQRVSSALGLSALTALTAMLRAQEKADRSALLSGVGANINPQIAAMQQHGPGGLIGVWQQLNAEVFAESYSNTFLVIAALTVLGIPLAALLPSGARAREKTVGTVEF